MPALPTVAAIQSLYASTRNTATRFASYNFHEYFVRRTDDMFKPVLASLSPPPGSTPTLTPDPNELHRFYQARRKELEVMERAATVSSMFKGPKLVVEHAEPITGGGGAGMEASAGGGGQRV
ncbi:hypothetical protein TREMEDRAFT_46147 [Tremella mesenterica DSM 1558]|uniref:uncharacterized protein n=1 Tax=Tremella mesenterica (strain ATCC 24925 / CBS 8224 / DSM 1558 / NBRC 9311 / NRRL Y-6157 / RJB 2259-6 / UBC 559-6) TaxID=578456 RepID=UPI00032D4AE5|nr:uncharacterized protein TREMEDRAFT_46147 [Tremella mesenterica DSM 1558]EIW65464.1 hypothetical protein TREMEDRAFT_46147 [Tremella mesenterica DSM 1558]